MKKLSRLIESGKYDRRHIVGIQSSDVYQILKKTLKKALTKYTGGYLFSVQPVFLTNW